MTVNGTYPTKQMIDSLNTGNETPLVVLKQNKKWLLFTFILLIILLFWSIFGAILPVLKTGDYNSVICYPGRTFQKILIFYACCIIFLCTPYSFISLLRNAGTYFFYNDRVELHAYWIKRKVVIPYNRMHIIRKSSVRSGVMWIIDTRYNVNSIMSHPLLSFKFRYWHGLRFTTFFIDQKIAGIKAGLTNIWENPEDGLKALQILKEKALSYEE